MKTKNRLPPIHPGEILKEDLLPSAGLSVTAAAKALGVSAPEAARHSGGAQTAVCRYVPEGGRLFGSTPEILDAGAGDYDLKKAEQDKKVMQRVARIVPIKQVRGSARPLTPSGLKNAGLSIVHRLWC